MTDVSIDIPVLALVRDLMFATKIAATARAEGVKVRIERDPQKLAAEQGQFLIIDLGLPQAIEAGVRWKQLHNGQVIGFVSHVDAETIERARSSGIDQVLTRGQFVQVLPQLLASSVGRK